MKWPNCLVSAAVLAVLLPQGTAWAQATAGPPETVRALVVQYADGFKTVTPIGTSGRVSWTARFPRVAGAETSRDGLPLKAMQFEEALDGQAVVVTIALLYGSPHQTRVPVTSVRVTGAQPVRVDALEAVGVQPIALSIVELPPAQLHIPSATSPSSQLEIGVDTVVAGAVPSYHAAIANHSDRSVMMLAFKAYRGNTIAISGRPRGPGHTALIPAGETYRLKLPASANGRGEGTSAWLPLDRLVITSVLWSDGLVEGDPVPAADEHALDAGAAQQLTGILALLRAAARDPSAHPLPQLRSDIASLGIRVTAEDAARVLAAIPGPVRLPAAQVGSTMEAGMRNARSAALNDLDEYIKSAPSPSGYAEWLARVTAKFDAWRRRITGV
jgi:hypothetical protein